MLFGDFRENRSMDLLWSWEVAGTLLLTFLTCFWTLGRLQRLCGAYGASVDHISDVSSSSLLPAGPILPNLENAWKSLKMLGNPWFWAHFGYPGWIGRIRPVGRSEEPATSGICSRGAPYAPQNPETYSEWM